MISSNVLWATLEGALFREARNRIMTYTKRPATSKTMAPSESEKCQMEIV